MLTPENFIVAERKHAREAEPVGAINDEAAASSR